MKSFQTIVLVELALVCNFLSALATTQVCHNNELWNGPLTPHQWTRMLTCNDSGPIDACNRPTEAQGICVREPTGWRVNYADELGGGQFRSLIKEANIDERLDNVLYVASSMHGLPIDAFKFSSGNPEEDARNMQLVSGPQVNDELCSRQLQQMLQLMDQMKAKRNQGGTDGGYLEERHIRLARVLDSFGRYQSGFLSGTYHSPGVYEQCIKTQLMFNDNLGNSSGNKNSHELVSTRYCWAKLSGDRYLSEQLRLRKRTLADVGDNLYHVAVCLPSSCHSKSFGKIREQLQRIVDDQFKLPASLYIDESRQIKSLFCLPDEISDYRIIPLNGRLLLIILLAWTALILVVTWRSKTLTITSAGGNALIERILFNLDLRKNWNEFLCSNEGGDNLRENQVNKGNRAVEFEVLSLTKTLSCGAIIFCHAIILQFSYSSESLSARAVDFSNPLFGYAIGAFNLVDLFFVITGTLMSYFIMKKINKFNKLDAQNLDVHLEEAVDVCKHPGDPRQTKGNLLIAMCAQYLIIAAYRYLRLVPLFALVFWFKKSVFAYITSGPFWDFGLNRDTEIGACLRESWATPFTFVGAYLPLTKQCMPVAWTVANDLFYCLSIVPVILMLIHAPRLALMLTVSIIIWSINYGVQALRNFDQQYLYDLFTFSFQGLASSMSGLSHFYTEPQYRIASVLIGIFTGFALYHYDRLNAATHKYRWPRWFTGPATVLAVLHLFLCFGGPIYFSYIWPLLNYKLSRWIIIYSTTAMHTSVSMAFAVLLVRMTTDWNSGRTMRFSGNRFWRILSKLNYALLLIHWDILRFNVASSSVQAKFNVWTTYSSFATSYLLCLPIAVYLHVVIENPLEGVIKTLFALLQ